jgi:hypothetical protein
VLNRDLIDTILRTNFKQAADEFLAASNAANYLRLESAMVALQASRAMPEEDLIESLKGRSLMEWTKVLQAAASEDLPDDPPAPEPRTATSLLMELQADIERARTKVAKPE